MKTFRAFGPTLGKGKLSKKILKVINTHVDKTVISKKNDYSSKLVSQIKDEVKLNDAFIKKNSSKELIRNIKEYLEVSGVGYLKIPKNMNQNKVVKNKKVKTNGTIDFINGQKNFLSKSIYNLNPKIGDLLIFPNYLMHAAYPFNVDGERRSFSFNVKIILKK